MSQPRAVLFDVDGVLIHSLFHPDPAQRRRWDQHLLEDLGVAPDHLAPFFGERFIDIIEGRKSLISELDIFLPTVNFRGSSLDFLSYWLARDTNLNLPLLQLIRSLHNRGDSRLFIATNQEHVRAFYLWHDLGLKHYFDDMFYAARFGAGKHSREFYDCAESLIGPSAAPPLFFDDSPKIVRAAQACGWEAVHYNTLHDFRKHPWIADRLDRNHSG